MRIADDGLPFILPPAILVSLLFALGRPVGGLLAVAATVLLGLFFRDPERFCDEGPGAVVSPADGRVIRALLEEDGSTRVVIFLSLFNVHVARCPIGGELVACTRKPGGYAAAYRDEASENARVEMTLRNPRGTTHVALMAGLVARRVLPWVAPPVRLRRGQRVAVIRFGSRSEVKLPRGFEPSVTAGQKVRADRKSVV